jgi:uncharacterized protein YbjT (DUF2867 family)
MNVLVTGANGNLGKIISKELSARGIYVIGASSRPKSGQKLFDLDLASSNLVLKNIDAVIHCARGNNYEHLLNDLDFITNCEINNVKILYIGSFSSWLLERNRYGEYKRTIEDRAIEAGGTVITCGLLFGGEYQGQIHKIGLILKSLPFRIHFKDAGSQRITPVAALVEEIFSCCLMWPKAGRIILAYPEVLNFNDILSAIGPRRLLSINLRRKFLEFFFDKIRIKLRYFNSDSLKGIYSQYSRLIEDDSEDKSKSISSRHAEQFTNLIK